MSSSIRVFQQFEHEPITLLYDKILLLLYRPLELCFCPSKSLYRDNIDRFIMKELMESVHIIQFKTIEIISFDPFKNS